MGALLSEKPYYEKFLESYRKNIGNDIEIHPDIIL